MCDYSLCGLPNRLAVEGEELEIQRFSTGTKGLASRGDLCSTPVEKEMTPKNTGFWNRLKALVDSVNPDSGSRRSEIVVCIPPGADLILKGIPADLRQGYGIEDEESVKFVQTSAASNTYRRRHSIREWARCSPAAPPRGLAD